MAVTITEMRGIGAGGGGVPVPDATQIATQQVIDADGSPSDPFASGVVLVEVDTDEDVRIEFGYDPDGDGFSFMVPAGFPRQFGVQPGWCAAAVAAVPE